MTVILLKNPGFIINHERADEIAADLFDKGNINKIEEEYDAIFKPTEEGIIQVKKRG